MKTLTNREQELLTLFREKKIKPKDIIIYFLILEEDGMNNLSLRKKSGFCFETVRTALDNLSREDLIEVQNMARKLGVFVHVK